MTTTGTHSSIPEEATRVVRDVFGFHSFRPHQEEIIRAILDRKDAFVVMPTGGGKSLCYQLPAHIMPGTCMVISPLISLMKDQVDAAQATGLRAAFLNSSQGDTERRAVEASLLAGDLDLLYVSPERYAMESFVESLKRTRLAFVAIDEAHCISEWGHDFRPDYLNLSKIAQEFPEVHVTAFTATATQRVQQDIIEKLGLRSPHIVRASFDRPNLFYKVVSKQSPSRQVLNFVKKHASDSGIIYRTTRKSVEETAAMLSVEGIKALPYHAGLDDATRTANQEAFNRDEVDVIVATIAFGMGIDKSNVRYVLHADLPKNIESYYQETGRAGRDGEPAECLLLFGYGDIPKIRFFFNEITEEDEKKHAIRCLNQMVGYATVHACRRKQLLNYFGEEFPLHQSKHGAGQAPEEGNRECTPMDANQREHSAGLGTDIRVDSRSLAVPKYSCCDICADEVERTEATQDAQIVMSAIVRTGQRFGMTHIVDVVTGSDTERIRQVGHDRIKTYGAGKRQDKRHWRFIIDNLLAQDLIEQTDSQYPGLRLRPNAKGVLAGRTEVFVLATKKGVTKRPRVPDAGPYNEQLFEELRSLRKRLAVEGHVPPYVVFNDRTLHEMARLFPTTESEMAHITGVGETKLGKYGPVFIETIRGFREEHPRSKESWADQEGARLRGEYGGRRKPGPQD